jgi:hypothetical protein
MAKVIGRLLGLTISQLQNMTVLGRKPLTDGVQIRQFVSTTPHATISCVTPRLVGQIVAQDWVENKGTAEQPHGQYLISEMGQ